MGERSAAETLGERPIEGYFLETVDRLIFDVKGLLHPPDRVVAYVRYVPDPRGSRVGPDGTRYAKVYSLLRREEVIRSRFPEYMYFDKFFNRWLQAVPLSRIRRVYSPTSRLREIVERGARDGLEELARGLAERLSSSGVELESMGVSGSLLVGLHTEGSDIDLVVYGEREGRLLYSYLKDVLTDQGELRAYREEELLKLYEFRSRDTRMPLREFLRVERRKVLEGVFKGRDFYIRLVKRPGEFGERYGERVYRRAGRATVVARVVDDGDSIFTPCRYLVDDVEVLEGSIPYPLLEVASFRGRFCEQAVKGERVLARGVVEVVEEKGRRFCRLLLGEYADDVMYPLERVE